MDANILKKNGIFRSSSSGTIDFTLGGRGKTVITYRMHGAWFCLSHEAADAAGTMQTILQNIEIVEKPCRFGGTRSFFRCNCIWNGAPCDKLAVKLLWQGRYFICRRCRGLPYASQNEVPWLRQRHSAIDALQRLGGGPQTKWWELQRPKGMWLKTFERHLREARRRSEAADKALVEFGKAYFAKIGQPLIADEDGRDRPKE